MFDTLRHLFLPHHTNNFRAKLLHLDFFAIYVLVFFAVSLSFRTIHKINPNILGFATDIHTEQLLSLTNQKRSDSGLPPLELNAQLSAAAAAKANDMFDKNYWAHVAPDGTSPWDFITGAGYAYTVAGENLAKNFSDSPGVVEAWMNSPTHRENILRSQYEDVGFAVVNGILNGEETTLVVQEFGKRLGAFAATPTETNPVPALGIPPVVSAQAQEEAVPVQYAPSPSPQVAASGPVKPVEITPYADVVKEPLFDIGTLIKRLSLGLSSILMIVLLVDAFYVWKHKIVRVGGKNVAHLLFLFVVTGFIWFMSFGSVL